ncbi:MAG: TcaA NTF2-like domain-containing protein, partial [Pseudomonadota bacterium]
FDRDAKTASGKPTDELNKTDKALLEEAMKNYENLLVEAVNKNDFTLVEPWLYPGSTLYVSQKKLVSDLYQKQIRERLDSYSVEAVEAVDYGAIYRVYVTENIGIQYPGKDFETKQYNWVYSLKSIYEDRQIRYQLTYIDKWVK